MQGVTQVGVQARIGGRECECLAEAARCLIITREPDQQASKLVQSLRMRAPGEEALVVRDRLGSASGGEQRASELCDRFGESRIECDDSQVSLDGRVEVALDALRVGEVTDGGGELRPQRQRTLAGRDRGLGLPELEQHPAQVVVRVGELGAQERRALQSRRGLLEAARIRVALAEHIVRLGIAHGRRIGLRLAAAVLVLATAAAGTGRVARGQNLKPIFTPSTRGRSGTSDLMNWADEVNRLASELPRFSPNASTCHWSLAT